jgi:hypothetical protein
MHNAKSSSSPMKQNYIEGNSSKMETRTDSKHMVRKAATNVHHESVIHMTQLVVLSRKRQVSVQMNTNTFTNGIT